MTSRWIQLVASVVAMVMIANLQYGWSSPLGSGQKSAFFGSDVDGVERGRN